MTTQAVPQTANHTLMGLDAKTRHAFERILSRPRVNPDVPSFSTVEYHETPALRFIVAYHPLRSWSYEYCAPGGGLRGKFDNRDSCLEALTAHMAVPA